MRKSNDSDTELLDRLRTGLLNDRPDTKRRVERSLAEDPLLQSEDRMVRRALDVLQDMTDKDAAINSQLRLRRRAVLSGAVERAAPLRMPRLTLGAVISVLLAMTIGWVLHPNGGDLHPRLSMLEREEITDLTDNLDFYSWLERRGIHSGKPPDGT